MERRSCTVEAADITVTFSGVDVLKSVSLELKPGEIHAITGENGAGKSSLAKVIAGVYRPRLGRILLDGEEISFKNPREALRHGIALIHQEPLTLPDLDIAENIFAGHHLVKAGLVDWRSLYARADALLAELGVTLDPHAKVGTLSVAQQQMVELASALSQDAMVWIFDETTAPLTPKEVEELFKVMRALKERGCAIAMVTHHLEELFLISDRITVLRDGEKVAEKATAETNISEIVQLMVGRELSSEKLHAESGSAAAPFLAVHNLSGPGFHDVSLDVRPGEVVCLSGLVGSGRTEFARALFGITRATAGSIQLGGAEVMITSPRAAKQMGIALVPEDRQHDGLLMPQAIAFNATLARLSKLCRSGWLNRKKLEQASMGYAERLRLAYRGQDQPVMELSGGNQQKVVISKWLMTEPKLLILDEPTRGVDVGAKHEVHKLIREQAEQGLAVLMISSDLPEVLALSDRILVMHAGTVVAEIEGKSATQEQVMFAATGQGAA
ncbi:MAG TPA: sugar ABC transporter ATP-binding protein [Fimbriimonadaceae bacterium]|jgi:rhamnose transport system ATP-binding protein